MPKFFIVTEERIKREYIVEAESSDKAIELIEEGDVIEDKETSLGEEVDYTNSGKIEEE